MGAGDARSGLVSGDHPVARSSGCDGVFQSRFVEGFVELVGDGVELALGAVAQAGLARQVLAQQPVGVLVAAGLPGAAGITEVDGDAAGDGEVGVLCHLPALVLGERAAELLGQLGDLGGERGGDNVGSVGFGEPDKHHEAAVSFDQCRDHAGALAVEEVAFRKGVVGPGGSGVAEVALRFGR